MSNNNVIKSFFNGDIRRFNLPDQEFTTLTSMLTTTYPELADKASKDYVIKFEDNDGDMVTIATKGELVEAFHCLGQGKVLRLFITLKDKPAQSLELKSAPVPSAPIQQVPQVIQTKEVKKDSTAQAAPAPQQQSKPVEKEEPLLSCLEAKALGLQLLSDNKVQAALPEALATLVNAISEGPLAIQSRLLDLSIVKSDPRCQKMVKFLLHRFGHFLPMASQALQSVGGIQGLQNMLPMVLPFIMQNLMRECGQQQPQGPPMWGPFGMPCGPMAPPPPMHHFGGLGGRGGPHHPGPDFGSLLGMLGSMGGMGGGPGSGFFPCGTPIPDVDCKPDVCPEELQQSKPCEQKPCDKTAEDTSVKCDKEIVHEGVSCDSCHAAPIKGVRYKCSVCPNFDLCAACEALNKHIENHPMIKISKPKSAIGCGNFPPFGAGGHPFPPFARGRGGPWARGPGHHLGHGWGRGRSASPCWRQSQPQNPNQPGAPMPTNEEKVRANFVRDLSIPDRSETLPNQTLVKTWAVQNTGTQPWPDGVKLIFARGDREVSTQEEFPIPPAKPNETVEVSAVLQTPATRGRYTVHYRMSDATRSFLFGPRLWADFCVAAGGEEGKPSASASSDQKDKTQTSSASLSLNTTSTAPSTAPSTSTGSNVGSTNQAFPLPHISTEFPDDRFQVQLQALAKMGFANRELNLLLLEKNNGNLQVVTEWLVKKLKDGAPEAM